DRRHSLVEVENAGLKAGATLENPFLAAQIAERSDVREDQGHAELVFRAHLAERDAAVFERDAAAAAVVADLHKLVLQGVLGQIVAVAAGGAEGLAVELPGTNEAADPARAPLQHGVRIQAAVR